MRLENIRVDAIDTANRIRQDLGDVKGLKDDIERIGLIHPIAVRSIGGGRYKLLAGKRRLAAFMELGRTEIPATVVDVTLKELEERWIELSENVERKQFEWAEEVKLKKEIHELQVAIHGIKVRGVADAKGWGGKDTARLLHVSEATISQDLELANIMETVPQLASCANKTEAVKLLDKLKGQILTSEKAAQYEKARGTMSADATKKKLIDSFIIRSFFEGVKEVPNGSIDFIEVDPPYAIGLESMKKVQERKAIETIDYTEVSGVEYLAFLENMLKKCYRVLATDRFIVVWFAPHPWFSTVVTMMQKAGFTIRGLPAVWNKGQGQTRQPNIYLASAAEFFFYGYKGSTPKMAKPGRPSVFSYKPVPPQRKIHPAERPVELMQDIVETFCPTHGRVLVPFLGSGNTLLACTNLRMQSFGYELSDTYKEAFSVRVHEGEYGEYRSYSGGGEEWVQVLNQ